MFKQSTHSRAPRHTLLLLASLTVAGLLAACGGSSLEGVYESDLAGSLELKKDGKGYFSVIGITTPLEYKKDDGKLLVTVKDNQFVMEISERGDLTGMGTTFTRCVAALKSVKGRYKLAGDASSVVEISGSTARLSQGDKTQDAAYEVRDGTLYVREGDSRDEMPFKQACNGDLIGEEGRLVKVES